jgi:hypothetical protein
MPNTNITGLISINDPDKNLDTIKLTVTQGTLVVDKAPGVRIINGGNGTNTITLKGGGDDALNTTLASLVYTPEYSPDGFNDVLNVFSTDKGGYQIQSDTTIRVFASKDTASVALTNPSRIFVIGGGHLNTQVFGGNNTLHITRSANSFLYAVNLTCEHGILGLPPLSPGPYLNPQIEINFNYNEVIGIKTPWSGFWVNTGDTYPSLNLYVDEVNRIVNSLTYSQQDLNYEGTDTITIEVISEDGASVTGTSTDSSVNPGSRTIVKIPVLVLHTNQPQVHIAPPTVTVNANSSLSFK